MAKPAFLSRCDPFLIISAGLILIFGLLGLYSISVEFAQAQLLFALLGVLGFIILSVLDYRYLRAASLVIFLVSLVLLVGVLLLGKEVGGTLRWFTFGSLFFTPSEFAKLALIVFSSSFLAKLSPPLRFRDLVLSAVPVVILSTLVFLQPSLGTALILGAIWVGLIWVAGIPYRHLFAGLLLAVILLPIGWQSLEDYQRERITSFLNPVLDPLGAGYNVIQSIIAVGSGRIFGKGFGMGTQSHLQFLPVRHTDFIFASLTEEWGLIGAALLLLLFGLLLWRILKIASFHQDKFGFLLGVGIFSFLFVQTVINVGMNIGLAPVTGVPLPLVSYGGSSLLCTLMALGVVNSLAIHRSDHA
jgi:rod shape determining protein RodA